MSTNSDRRQFFEKFKDKAYRDLFIAEHIYTRLPIKIRGLREQRGWSQKELGKKIGMAQAWVSKLEDPTYGKYTIATLLRLASAFDVGLDIDFRTFSEILDKALALTPESFEVDNFTDDPGFLEYRTSTAEWTSDRPIIGQFRRDAPDQGGRRDVPRPESLTRRITSTNDTQNLIGRVAVQKRETAEMLEEFNVHAETAR